MSEPKTITCRCGKDIIIMGSSFVTELCDLCPMKLGDFFIRFRKNSKHYGKFVHVRARSEGDAIKLFHREYPASFGSLVRRRGEMPPGYNQLGEVLEYKYSKDELETVPGDPKYKKRPRKRRKR